MILYGEEYDSCKECAAKIANKTTDKILQALDNVNKSPNKKITKNTGSLYVGRLPFLSVNTKIEECVSLR